MAAAGSADGLVEIHLNFGGNNEPLKYQNKNQIQISESKVYYVGTRPTSKPYETMLGAVNRDEEASFHK